MSFESRKSLSPFDVDAESRDVKRRQSDTKVVIWLESKTTPTYRVNHIGKRSLGPWTIAVARERQKCTATFDCWKVIKPKRLRGRVIQEKLLLAARRQISRHRGLFSCLRLASRDPACILIYQRKHDLQSSVLTFQLRHSHCFFAIKFLRPCYISCWHSSFKHSHTLF
jgi:hypothetical protein